MNGVMPFKTKKKKARASKNRISLSESGLLTYYKSSETTPHQHVRQGDKSESRDAIAEDDHSKTRQELVRIFLLSVVIIGLQLALKASNFPIFR